MIAKGIGFASNAGTTIFHSGITVTNVIRVKKKMQKWCLWWMVCHLLLKIIHLLVELSNPTISTRQLLPLLWCPIASWLIRLLKFLPTWTIESSTYTSTLTRTKCQVKASKALHLQCKAASLQLLQPIASLTSKPHLHLQFNLLTSRLCSTLPPLSGDHRPIPIRNPLIKADPSECSSM